MSIIKNRREERRINKEKANENLAKNFCEMNIKTKFLRIIKGYHEAFLNKGNEASAIMLTKRNIYLKKLFFSYVNLYLEYEKDKMIVFHYNYCSIRKVRFNFDFCS